MNSNRQTPKKAPINFKSFHNSNNNSGTNSGDASTSAVFVIPRELIDSSSNVTKNKEKGGKIMRLKSGSKNNRITM
jgi:hypothetical protein